jgi:hypothetical protein
MELSKQLLTLVEKTQIFYLVKEFALFSLLNLVGEREFTVRLCMYWLSVKAPTPLRT